MKCNFLYISCLVGFLLQSCAPKVSESYDEKNGYTGSISISGAFALYPLAVLWAEDYKKTNPNLRFNISAGGAGKGIADVLTDMVDIGLVSRDLHPQELEKGALPIHVAKDAVIGTVNSKHPDIDLIKKRGFTQEELQQIFLEGKFKNWNEIDSRFSNTAIEVYVRSDAAGAAETWAKFFGGNQEDLKGIGIFGDPGLAQAIKENPKAIGFNNLNYVFDLKTKKTSENIVAIPIDLNKNGQIDANEDFYEHLDSLTHAVATNVYPSPPARDLTFVIRSNKQSNLLKDFIRFILNDTEQSYLLENGYVPLDKETIIKELEKLNASELQVN